MAQLKECNSVLMTKWKKQIKDLIYARYGELDDKKVEKYLNKIIEKNLKNPSVDLINNYKNKEAHSDLLSIIDLIYNNNLIIGAAGTLFQQHKYAYNPFIEYLMELMRERKKYKAERKKYPKGSLEWFYADLAQLNYKLNVNSAYGAIGYARFILFNIFLAEAITTMGKNIISSAACGFENFLGDNIYFNEPSEMYHYITNIINECNNKYCKYEFDKISPDIGYEMVYDRLINKCKFNVSNSIKTNILNICKNMSSNERILVYYKNNFFEFNKLEPIRSKLEYIINNVGELMLPEISSIKDEACKALVEELWSFYEIFVFYDYPIYDRIRKTAYTDKNTINYIDTDSNFIALNPWMNFVRDNINCGPHSNNLDYICVNLITIFLSIVVEKNLFTMCKKMNITDEYAKKLGMKNEFYFRRIVFTKNKKWYLCLAMIQEGQLLNDGEGEPEIKGIAFKKSTTKKVVRDFYTNLCEENILKSENIDVEEIFFKLIEFKNELKRSIRSGESTYYKQATVQTQENYAVPFSTQGFKSVYLWNKLCPAYYINLPMDVDIIPIRDLSKKKNLEWFSNKYPNEYEILKKEILENPDKAIREMKLNYIAKPKNNDLVLPDWFADLIDTDKIINDTLTLFYPVMESLGMNIVKTTSVVSHMTNVISI